MVETLEYFTELWKQNVTLEVSVWQEMKLGHIFKGKAAMGYATPHGIREAVLDDPDFKDKLGFMHLSRKQGGAWCGASFLFMGSETKNEAAAWDFMKFFWEADEMWERYVKAGAPVIRESLGAKFDQDDPYMNANLMKYVSVGVGAPKVPYAGPYLFKYLPQAQQDAFYGKKDAKQALTDAVKDLEKELELTK
jgi:ABC-type glycerol-3-phosphate transport system substrate-binding protein